MNCVVAVFGKRFIDGERTGTGIGIRDIATCMIGRIVRFLRDAIDITRQRLKISVENQSHENKEGLQDQHIGMRLIQSPAEYSIVCVPKDQ